MRSERKLTIKVSQRINSIMNRVDKALRAKHGGDKEFYGILLAPRSNPWMCKDIIIPKQKVTSASITVPKDGMHAPYQKHFEDGITEGKEDVVIGTIHSHNSMSCFFSGGDDEDLENNSCFNLNEGLPFIDIVWSNKDNSYKGRVRVKIGKGESKQIFTIDNCECALEQDDYTGGLVAKIKDRVLQEFKSASNEYFTLEENRLGEELSKAVSNSMIPNVDFNEILENIEVEYYGYKDGYKGFGGYYKYKNSYNWDRNPKPVVTYQNDYLEKGGDVQLDISDYNETERLLTLKCTGTDKAKTDFIDMLESDIGCWFDRRSTIYKGDGVTIEIKCESKKRYKKMSRRIEHYHNIFQKNGKNIGETIEEVQTTIKPMTDEEAHESFHNGYSEVPVVNRGDIDYAM